MEMRAETNFVYKVLQIPHNCDMEVIFATPPGNPHRLYDITNEDCLSLNDIYRQVARSGVLDKFWSNKHLFPQHHEEESDASGETSHTTTTQEITDEDTDIEQEQHLYDELRTDTLKQYNPQLVKAARESLSDSTTDSSNIEAEKTAVIAEFS